MPCFEGKLSGSKLPFLTCVVQVRRWDAETGVNVESHYGHNAVASISCAANGQARNHALP